MNIGAVKPGYFLEEMDITKSNYKSWFEKIADVNANHRSLDFNSLADFFINPENKSIELRVP